MVLTGGLLGIGRDTTFFIWQLSSILSEKWHQSYLVV
jgi:hypothetical protein